MKRKELFWMIAPCLLLIGAGAYLSQRQPKEFGIVIDEAKLTPATPREVAKGYDTKLVIKTHLINIPRGEEPSPNLNYRQYHDVKIAYYKNGKQIEMPPSSYITGLEFRREDLTWEDTYGLKLADVPASWGQLKLQLTVDGDQLNYSLRRVVRKTSKVSLLLPLRQTGQRIPHPRPDRQRPFTIKSVTNQWMTDYSRKPIYIDSLVTIRITPLTSSIPVDRRRVRLENIVLESEKGLLGRIGQYATVSDIAGGKMVEISRSIEGRTIPANLRNVTLKADLSVDECWPLPISVVLRKDGKNITRDVPTM